MSKLLQHPESPEDWHRLARQLIRMHMTLLGWRFADLSRALAAIGVDEAEINLRNRIGLGRFRAALFIQCLMAMGVDELRLPLIVAPSGRQLDDKGPIDGTPDKNPSTGGMTRPGGPNAP